MLATVIEAQKTQWNGSGAVVVKVEKKSKVGGNWLGLGQRREYHSRVRELAQPRRGVLEVSGPGKNAANQYLVPRTETPDSVKKPE